uniref:Uncharacterized protein n=1 Tax=Lepeophtheirus salmonis TaxID=72036 RepID=A0A0K2TNT2_LEPSM
MNQFHLNPGYSFVILQNNTKMFSLKIYNSSFLFSRNL